MRSVLETGLTNKHLLIYPSPKALVRVNNEPATYSEEFIEFILYAMAKTQAILQDALWTFMFCRALN